MAHVSRNVFKRVVAYDPYIIDGDFPAYVERVASLTDLACQADVVTLHTPLNAETRGMVNAKFFRRTQARDLLRQHVARRGGRASRSCCGARYRNPGRCSAGRVAGRAGAAGLAKLIHHPRVILTCRTPRSTQFEAIKELRRKAAQNIISWFATGKPEYVVTRGSRTPD